MDDKLYCALLYNLKPVHVYRALDAAISSLRESGEPVSLDICLALEAARDSLPEYCHD